MRAPYSIARMPNWIKTLMLVGCVSICILGVLLISFFPGSFGAGPYCTVHGPLQQIGSISDWRAVVARFVDPDPSALLASASSCPLRSTDLRTFTCTLNC